MLGCGLLFLFFILTILVSIHFIHEGLHHLGWHERPLLPDCSACRPRTKRQARWRTPEDLVAALTGAQYLHDANILRNLLVSTSPLLRFNPVDIVNLSIAMDGISTSVN